MAYASYRLHRIGWVAWRWVAEYRGEFRAKGVALTEAAARAAARVWLQAMADADASLDVGAPAPVRPPVVPACIPERPLRDKAGPSPAGVGHVAPTRNPVQPTFGRRAARPVQHGGVGAR